MKHNKLHMLLTSAVVAFGLTAGVASANNVIPTQYELTDEQIAWVNEHRADEEFGELHNFVWYRAEGRVFSASINEFHKSRHKTFTPFFEEYINVKLQAEAKAAVEQFDKATNLVGDLMDTGIPFEAAVVLAKFNVQGFDVVNGIPQFTNEHGLVVGGQ